MIIPVLDTYLAERKSPVKQELFLSWKSTIQFDHASTSRDVHREQTEPITDEGEVRSLSAVRFRGWHEAERHFLGLGAKQESLRHVDESLRKTGVAILICDAEGTCSS